MSEIRTPPSLKWLLTRRARLLGELQKLEKALPQRLMAARKAVKRAESTLQAANRRSEVERAMTDRMKKAMQSDLAAIDAILRLHEIPIDLEAIAPIRTQEAGRVLHHGAVTRAIFECLSQTDARPASTTEVALYVAMRNGLELDDVELGEFRYKVRQSLKGLCQKGKVDRVHQAKTRIEGRWQLPSANRHPHRRPKESRSAD